MTYLAVFFLGEPGTEHLSEQGRTQNNGWVDFETFRHCQFIRKVGIGLNGFAISLIHQVFHVECKMSY